MTLHPYKSIYEKSEDDPCWDDYEQIGTKKKNGKEVSNYVPVKEKLTIPLEVGDEVRLGKFKNKKAIVKGFGTDPNNQPTVKTTKGETPLFKFRISKLMPPKE